MEKDVPPGSESGPRPWNPLAIVAAVLGGLALVFWLPAGPPALLTGYFALVQINRNDGRQRGIRLALTGMILGGLGCLFQVVWFAVVIVVGLAPYQARSTDANHLRQMGVALNVFQDRNEDRYPPAVSPRGSLPVDERLSWLVLQLPYLEAPAGQSSRYTDLTAQLDLSAGYADAVNAAVRAPLRIYRSPNAPPETAPADFTSYVGTAGIGPNAISLPRESPQAGLFGYPRRIGRDDLKAGTSVTLAVVETTQGGPWARGGPGTAASVPTEGDDLFGPGRPFGGLHPEGVHWLFADGSVSYRRTDFPADLFRRHVRINRPNE